MFVFSQMKAQSGYNLDYVDRYAAGIKNAPPEILAKELTAPFSTDLEKTRAIFRWITLNISYGSPSIRSQKSTAIIDTTDKYQSLDERVAEKVLQRRWGVCDGYSRLFKTLCGYAGIKAEVISGYSRGDIDRVGARFNTNHTWNAVYLDSSWRLLDVTWASGYFIYGSTDYFQQLNERYFLTPPEEFIQDHYPEDFHWALLQNVPVLQEYYRSPFKTSGYTRARIKSFFPTEGVIHATLGDTVSISIYTDDKEKNLLVVDTLYDDEHAYDNISHSGSSNSSNGRQVKYDYVVRDLQDKWLAVVLNDRTVLRYKLLIRKPEKSDLTGLQ